jgi:hypothetical protein
MVRRRPSDSSVLAMSAVTGRVHRLCACPVTGRQPFDAGAQSYLSPLCPLAANSADTCPVDLGATHQP